MSGFMGVGMGMNANGNYFAQASQTNQQQMQEKQNQQNAQGATDTWTCPQCGTENTGSFVQTVVHQNQQTKTKIRNEM